VSRGIKIALGVLLALALIIVATLWWLGATASGARAALGFARDAVPGFELGLVRGSLRDGLHIASLRYETDSQRIEVVDLRARFQPADWGFRRGALTLSAAQVLVTERNLEQPGASIDLRWPQLPALPMLNLDPIALSVGTLTVKDRRGATTLNGALTLRGGLDSSELRIDAVDLQSPQLTLSGSARQTAGTIQPIGELQFRGAWATGRYVGTGDALQSKSLLTLDAPLNATLVLNRASDQALTGSVSVPRQPFEGRALSAELSIAGTAAEPQLKGRARWGDWRIREFDGRFGLSVEALTIEALSARVPGYFDRIEASGYLSTQSARNVIVDGKLTPAPGLVSALDGLPNPLDLDFALRSESGAQRLTLTREALDLVANRQNNGAIDFNLAVSGEALRATGTFRDNALNVEATLKAFNPSRLVLAWPGQLDGKVQWQTADLAALDRSALTITDLTGVLRDKPVRASGTLKLVGFEWPPEGTLSAEIGANTLDYRGDTPATLRFALDDPGLLLADTAGQLRGTLEWIDAQSLKLQASGDGVQWQDQRMDTLTLDGRVPTSLDGPIALTLDARGLTLAKEPISRATLTVDGVRSAHVLSLDVDAAVADLTMALSGGQRGARWRYRTDALIVTPTGEKPLKLVQPGAMEWKPTGLALDSLCLGRAAAKLCAEATLDAATSGSVAVDAEAIDLSEWFGSAIRDRGFALNSGLLTARSRIALERGELASLDISADLPRLSIRPVDEDRTLEINGLVLSGRGSLENFLLTVQSGDGPTALNGTLSSRGPERALEGAFRLESRDALTWLLSSDEVRGVRGVMDADVRVSGTAETPVIMGRAAVNQFALRIPSIGMQLKKTDVTAQIDEQGQIALNGAGELGEGPLRIDGTAALRPLALNLRARGENLKLLNTTSLKLTGSPDLSIRLEEGLWQVDGQVPIPSGLISLDQLNDAVRASPDQEFTDVDVSEASAALPLKTDIDLKLGPDVRLSGVGLTGTLSGDVKLLVRPNEEPLGKGELSVGGRYLAFGRKLDIETALLRFNDSPVANPSLNIRASRMVGRVKAGVRVRGTALDPDIRIYSDPTSTQADALSYLVVGRPLNQSRAGDQAKLSTAAQDVGSGLLAQEIGLRFGLDDVSMEDGGALDGPRLMLGKYLSPRIYVAYGISQFDSSTLFRVRYLINQKFDVEVERGKELRSTVNYRIDR
jgi:translocation and assembly module TamB